MRRALAALVLSSAALAEAPEGDVIARVPKGAVLSPTPAVFSGDGKQVAFEATVEDATGVYLNGKLANACDAIEWMQFSPGTNVLGRVILVKDHHELWIGDRKMLEGEDLSSPEWTADGTRVVCVVKTGATQAVFDGNAKGKPYDQVRWLALSPDGKHVAFAGKTAGQAFAVLDGAESGPYDDVIEPRFSQSGGVLAFAARKGKTWRVVHGDKEEPAHEQVSLPEGFSPDGTHLAWIAQDGTSVRLVHDGKEDAPHEGFGPEVLFRKDGGLLACTVYDKKRCRLLLNGKQSGRECSFIDQLRLSPDGLRVACVAKDGDKTCVVVDGHEGADFVQIHGLTFSPDSAHFAYAAWGDRVRIVLDTRVVATSENPCEQVRFSPDAKTLSFGLLVEKEFRWVRVEVK